MARNIEIKARLAGFENIHPRIAALATEGPMEIEQDDTFFRCESGRLKLRAFSPTDGELIFYQRDDRTGPKESFYLRSMTTTPEVLRELLTLAYGQTGRVRKYRTLYWIGRTRVHLDRVDDLGTFLELEVVLGDNEPRETGIQEAEKLLGQLHVSSHQLVERAYVDLLESSS